MAVDLPEVLDALFGRFFLGVAAGNFEKLEWMLRHDYAACLSDSISVPSSAAFGLTSQNFGKNVR